MPKQTVAFLKGLFTTGKIPTQQNFFDWLDSFVHKDDVAGINAGTINTAIGQYDTQLKAQSPDGVVNTLGDVFKVFQNYSDGRNLSNELKWSGIPERPIHPIALGYSAVQRIALWNIDLVSWPNQGGTSSSRERSLKGLLGVSNETPITIVDMILIRVLVTTPTGTATIVMPNMIDIGINPRTTI